MTRQTRSVKKQIENSQRALVEIDKIPDSEQTASEKRLARILKTVDRSSKKVEQAQTRLREILKKAREAEAVVLHEKGKKSMHSIGTPAWQAALEGLTPGQQKKLGEMSEQEIRRLLGSDNDKGARP